MVVWKDVSKIHTMKTLLLSLGTVLYTFTIFGQDGSADNTFNPGTGANNMVYTVSQDPNGKLMASGFFTSINGTAMNHIARFNLDGTLDNSFTPGSGLGGDGAWKFAYQSDGKMLVVGYFSSVNGSSASRIARLNTNGTFDNTFVVGSGFNNTTAGIAVQSDGKVIVGGSYSSYNGTSRNAIVRLNSDGSLDNSFNIGTGLNQAVRDLILQPDGKVIVVGAFTSYNGTSRNYIVRLNTDGSLDNTFNIGSGASSQIYSVALQADGKILIGGLFTSFNGTTAAYLARLNTDGSLDNTFSTTTGASSEVRSISQLSDGKIFIAGTFTSYKGTSINRVARLTSTGALDAGFNVGTGSAGTVFSGIQLSGGKIAIGGVFTSYNGSTMNYLGVLQNTGGSLPMQFGALNLTKISQGVLLNWSLAETDGNEVMNVQRRTDRSDWTTIHSSRAMFDKKTYEYKDLSLVKETVYYRIEIVSASGNVFYSTIKSLIASNVVDQKSFVIKGTVISDGRVRLTVNTEEPIGLSDMNGKLIRFYYLEPGEQQITVTDLQKGIYVLKSNTTVSRFAIK